LPLNTNIKSALLLKAKEIATNFQSYNFQLSENNAIEILLIAQEYDILKGFLNKNIHQDVILDDFNDISSVTIRIYESYPKELQALMVKNFTGIAQKKLEFSGFDINEIMEFLKDKIPCKELKKLYELHKDVLFTFRLPKNCS
jgi:hypothetical protein